MATRVEWMTFLRHFCRLMLPLDYMSPMLNFVDDPVYAKFSGSKEMEVGLTVISEPCLRRNKSVTGPVGLYSCLLAGR